MNAGQEASVNNQYHIYRTIHAIMGEDYDAWIKMNTHELMTEVMKRTCGLCNPSMVNRIIQEL